MNPCKQFFKKKCKIIILLCLFPFLNIPPLFCDNLFPKQNPQTANISKTVEVIMENIEKKYSQAGFSADFNQVSTLKALDITDTASGTMIVKRPGMMRWEYEKPEKQIIISDGDKLWIYRPEDNQVLTGRAPEFFKEGKGAGFLSDMKILRKKFNISLVKNESDSFYMLKLLPNKKMFDISSIFIKVLKRNFNIVRIITYNSYEDETKIDLVDIKFKEKIDDSIFNFIIPEGIDVLQINESES
ncbi:MAG TPA: outer membrane lipoprotein carrier protein LolA [Desulfobacteraceae bacterium]|nr:outer membrane lipoprotein carrier protein LolA [Desulfobacteraceae bacterium]